MWRYRIQYLCHLSHCVFAACVVAPSATVHFRCIRTPHHHHRSTLHLHCSCSHRHRNNESIGQVHRCTFFRVSSIPPYPCFSGNAFKGFGGPNLGSLVVQFLVGSWSNKDTIGEPRPMHLKGRKGERKRSSWKKVSGESQTCPPHVLSPDEPCFSSCLTTFSELLRASKPRPQTKSLFN